MKIPYDQLGGVHFLTAILMDPVRYATNHGGHAFKQLVCLPLYDGTIMDGATNVICIRAEMAHQACLDDYASYEVAECGVPNSSVRLSMRSCTMTSRMPTPFTQR
jgi:hypothetical protein